MTKKKAKVWVDKVQLKKEAQHQRVLEKQWAEREREKVVQRKAYKGKGYMPQDLRPWDRRQKGAAVIVKFNNDFSAADMLRLNKLGFLVERVWAKYFPASTADRFHNDRPGHLEIMVKCAGDKGVLVGEAEAYPVVAAANFERWVRGYRKPKKAKEKK